MWQWYKLYDRLMYSTSELDAEKEPIQVQLAQAWWCVLSNYSGMTRTTVRLQAHEVCNCTIMAQIRPADDQSDSRILIYLWLLPELLSTQSYYHY